MDLSICILTHSQPTLLPECVEACLAEITRSPLAAEIIIIDNARQATHIRPSLPAFRR
jgi:hypothetical protein